MQVLVDGVRRRFDARAPDASSATQGGGLDPAAIDAVRAFGPRLALPLLGMMKARASARWAQALRWLLLIATIGAALVLTWNVAMQDAAVGFAGALAPSLLTGLLAGILVELGARGRLKSAQRAFAAVEGAFVAYLGEATTGAHQRLVDLRRRMQGPGDLLGAVLAAQEARTLTDTLARFLTAAPLFATPGEARACPHVFHDIRMIAANANRRGLDRLLLALAALVGAGLGAGMLAMSLAGPLALAPPPPIVEALTMLLESRPRTVTGAFVMVLLVGSVAAAPSMLVEFIAERDPRPLLGGLEIASALNDLRAAAGAALAVRPAEAQERYAEAFAVLGARLDAADRVR